MCKLGGRVRVKQSTMSVQVEDWTWKWRKWERMLMLV